MLKCRAHKTKQNSTPKSWNVLLAKTVSNCFRARFLLSLCFFFYHYCHILINVEPKIASRTRIVCKSEKAKQKKIKYSGTNHPSKCKAFLNKQTNKKKEQINR